MKDTHDKSDDELFRGLGVEIKFKNESDFLKIKETLQRIGIVSKKSNTLFQSCHVLHKQGRYAIMHFKEMFIQDGKESDFSLEDKRRRNTITGLLEDWGLLEVLDKSKIEDKAPMAGIKVLSFKEKQDYILQPKYNIGKPRRKS